MSLGSLAAVQWAGSAVAPPRDLLGQATKYVRRQLDPSLPAGQRIRLLWVGVVAARDLAADDVLELEFPHLASDCGLTADLGRHGKEDVRHVIRWALLGRNPFGPGRSRLRGSRHG